MAYPNAKTVHKAAHIAPNGDVSALCFIRPKRIDLSKALWTIVDGDVTCSKCLRILSGKEGKVGGP